MNKALLSAIILGLCAVGINGLAISSSPVVCTEENDDSLHPDLMDCFHYYHCDRGVAHRKICPVGLAFNPRIKQCDYLSGVPECSGVTPGLTPSTEKPQPTPAPSTSRPQPTPAPPSTSGPQPTAAPPATTAPPPKTTTKVPTAPPPGDLSCPADSDLVYYPITGACSSFYLCRDGAYVGSYNCQEGLNFSPARQACVRPEKYSC